MAVRYVKDFEFPSAAGYTKSAPSKVTGQMLAKGGPAKAPKGPGLMVMIGIPKKPMKKADGGGVVAPYDINQPVDQMPSDMGKGAVEGAQAGGLSPQMRQKLLMMQAAKRKAMMAGQDTRMNDVPPSVNYDQGQMQRAEQGYKKGGKIKSVPVKDIKSGKVKQSTDEDFYGKAKDMPMPTRRPMGLKKGGYAEGGPLVTGLAEDEGRYTEATRNARAKRQLKDFGDKAAEARWAASQARGSDWADKKSRADTADEQEAFARKYADKTATETGYKKGGKVHDDAAQDKAMIKSMIKPSALKKAGGGMAQKVQMAKSNAVEASLKGQKKTGYADGGPMMRPPLGGTPASPDKMGQQYTPGQGSALQSLAANARQNVSPDQLGQMASAQRGNAALAAAQAMQSKGPLQQMGRSVPVAPRGPMIQQQGAIERMMSSPNQPEFNPANAGKSGLNGGLARSMAARPNPAASVPVASRSPLYMYGPAQAGMPSAPAGRGAAPQSSRGMKNGGMAESAGGARIGVNAPRPGQPNVGAIRAAMARKASQAMPENAPGMMKKGGKVGC
jgi:hypothetical protein